MCRLFNKCNEKSIARNTPLGYLGDAGFPFSAPRCCHQTRDLSIVMKTSFPFDHRLLQGSALWALATQVRLLRIQ